MQYHLRSKPQKGKHFKTIIAVVLFVVLTLFVYVFPNATRTTVTAITKPLWAIRNNAGKPFTFVRDFFKFKSSLISQNLALENEVLSLRLKQIDYDAILNENQTLVNQTGRDGRITSRVLAKPPQSPYDTIVLGSGSANGVIVGSRVYMSDTIVVGTVASVTSDTSVVQLFSTGGNKQQATLARTGTMFEIQGSGGANFQVEVPKETDIAIGDTFLYPNTSVSVLAVVYNIDPGSQSSFKKVYMRIPGNIFASQWVFVEKI